MPLDKIPIISEDVLDTHCHDRHDSPEEFRRFNDELREHLEKNKVLRHAIKVIADQSQDPNAVYHAAYTIMGVINAQYEVDELNNMHKRKYSVR